MTTPASRGRATKKKAAKRKRPARMSKAATEALLQSMRDDIAHMERQNDRLREERKW